MSADFVFCTAKFQKMFPAQIEGISWFACHVTTVLVCVENRFLREVEAVLTLHGGHVQLLFHYFPEKMTN